MPPNNLPHAMAGWSLSLWLLFITLLFTVLLLAMLYWQLRRLYRHIPDIQPSRQVSYLLERWRIQPVYITLLFLLYAGSIGGIIHWLPPIQPAITAPAEPIAADAPTQVQTPPPAADEPLQLGDEPVLELFTSLSPDIADELDNLKQRYENALAGAYLLHHCKRASEEEITTLQQALRDEIVHFQQRISAEGDIPLDVATLYSGIVSAAEGSFQLFYHRTPCDAPAIDMLEQQFASFVLKYKQNVGKKSETP